MEKQCFYNSDIGSLTLMNKNGTRIHLNNGFGDGMFEYYLFDTFDELESHLKEEGLTINDIVERVWLSEKDWKVMNYDCPKDYESSGEKLGSKYVVVYSYFTTFFIVNEEFEE